jgi:uncharacterized repeat protein (TIGR03803 family)
MHTKGRFPHDLFGASLRPDSAALAILVFLLFLIFVFLFLTLTVQPGQAQTFRVIHNFTGGGDGANPYAGLTIDASGNLYGTTVNGGSGYGTIFKLSNQGLGWIFTPLHSFKGNDGAGPAGGLTIGPDGALYGTTYNGGSGAAGTVFNLMPGARISRNIFGNWIATVLYGFSGGTDGGAPEFANLIFDPAGSLYGTAAAGGSGGGGGVVYQLTPSQGGWTESVLYSFQGDGFEPLGGVIFDYQGNLYGTTAAGGDYNCGGLGCGTVFKLTRVGSGWTKTVLYSFQGGSDGGIPVGGLRFGVLGDLYGTTSWGGQNGGGTAFELEPYLGGHLTVITSFTGTSQLYGGPTSGLTSDSSSNLYGTTCQDGAHGAGSIYKLIANCCTGCYWTYSLLHDFSGSDGEQPWGDAVLAPNGHLFGTTSSGGAYGNGVVWEMIPTEGLEIGAPARSSCSAGQ